jgi:hypothetical protein
MNTFWKVVLGFVAIIFVIFAIVGFVDKVGHPGWKSGEWFAKANAEEDAPKVEYIYIENSSSNGNIGSVSDEPEAPEFVSIRYARR